MERSRRLRTYERMAQRTRTCDICNRDIHPGDVSVNETAKAGRIYTFKMDISPTCPSDFFDEQEEIIRRGEENVRKDMERMARDRRQAA